MSGDEIEKFGNTRGIDSLVATKACCNRSLRITKIDQCYREMFVFELLRSEAIDGGAGSPVDEILKGNLLGHLLTGTRRDRDQNQRAKRGKGFDLHRHSN